MGSKTISLDDDAYTRLTAAKRPGESFSDVVKRMTTGKRSSFLRLRGLLTPAKGRKLRAAIDEMREEDLRAQEAADRRWS